MIKVRFAWPAVPVVFVSVNALPFGWIATCLGLLVLVRTSHFQDEPTAAHELEHCRQTIKGLALIHFIRYHASARYRLRCEAKAFAAEIYCSEPASRPAEVEHASQSLALCYGIACTRSVAATAIQKELFNLIARNAPLPIKQSF